MRRAFENPGQARERGQLASRHALQFFSWKNSAAIAWQRIQELVQNASAKPLPAPIKIPAVAQIGRLDEARELFVRKNFQAAWEAAGTAIAKRPFHPEAFLLLAEIALAAGDGSAAKRCAQRARDLVPNWKAPKQFLQRPLKGNAKLAWLDTSRLAPQAARLSICLIVKNEEQFLVQCLKSVRDLAAQIVLVDTGSTDRTVEIAREFGAEIYSFAWCDDFAAARNAALEHATGDWVLMLDADEELPADQHAKLRADMKNTQVIAFRLPLINRDQEAEGRSFVPRLFRNSPDVFHHGRIHEQVFPSLVANAQKWGLKTALGTAQLLHHGYSKEMVRDRNKVERNLKLLRLAVVENPADINLVMNFGLELVRSDDLAGGLEKYREAFQMMSAQPAAEVVPELREALLTQFTSQLYKVRGHAEVVAMLHSPLAQNGGLTASLHLALGLAHFELKQFSEAADQMRQCIATCGRRVLTPVNVDIHTAAPLHCLALCLAQTGDSAGAEKTFLEAIAAPARTNEARLDYAKFLSENGRAVDALHQLHTLVAADAQFVPAWKLGGQIALAQPEFLEFALDWTGEAVRALPGNSTIVALRAETLLIAGKTNDALESWLALQEKESAPRTLAALILCQTVESPTTHAPEDGPEESATSRAFIEWYQRLITMRANGVVEKINGQLDKLSRALPSAALMLENALAEAETPAEV
jgi:tetratricopeptide (TPR) repeat protein